MQLAIQPYTWQNFWIHPLPATGIGIGYKPMYYENIKSGNHQLSWLEIHAENYMMDGGIYIEQLQDVAQDYPISCHGVGLSIGSPHGLDTTHLSRLQKLTQWLQPSVFSEHLAWSTHTNGFLNDLLPVPYTSKVLAMVIDHIHQVQDTLGCNILIENPSTYITYTQSVMSEAEFVTEVVRGSGCGLLLDVNNIYVSATNQQIDPQQYLTSLPLDSVGEIHIGGHAQDIDEYGDTVLIDSHNTKVASKVWDIYQRALQRIGSCPTLLEWDNDLPHFTTIHNQAITALTYLSACQK